MSLSKIAIVVVLALVCLSRTTYADIQPCANETEKSGKEYNVLGDSISVREGPGTNFKRIVNQKATRILKETIYVTIDSSARVLEECTSGEWSNIRVVQPEWLRDAHRGWVLSKFLDKAQSKKSGDERVVYVVSEFAEERSAPNTSAEVINRSYRGQSLTVYESVNGWDRVTADGFQARWVEHRLLSADRLPAPSKFVIPAEYRDSRIAAGAIPEAAGNGLSEEDVLLLWRGAKYMLVKGRCNRVDYADKSVSRVGTYFVQEGYRNIYFTEADLR
ncbi:MAG: SH3 domain-containing protein [Candidatus Hydrogenedentes bacterium]|nr:SH3 domain-containing protein [Candidatus Hydrogenedentota bacterium]